MFCGQNTILLSPVVLCLLSASECEDAIIAKRPYHRSVEQNAWLHEQYQAMEAEADYTAEKLLEFKNVIAEYVRDTRFCY